jgi:hypothetical protein
MMAAFQTSASADGQPLPMRPTDVDLGQGYVRRDGAIHFIGGGITGTGADATRIDTPSPQLLKKVVDSRFGSFKTAEGLDVASFEVLSEEYTRDKDRVYFKVISTGEFIVIVLPDADPKSFDLLAPLVARDRNHVWYYDRTQPGADPATLKLVDGGGVYKDGKLMAETISYDSSSPAPTGTITAEVSEEGLKNIRISPPPGGSRRPSVPDWQIEVFKRPDLLRQILKAGELLPRHFGQP